MSSDSDDEQPYRGRRRMAKVNMPTGKSIAVTVPARPCMHVSCDFTVNLILLRPEGTMGRRERRIIVRQMMDTIQQHALQEQGGGRFTSYDVVEVHKVVNACLWKRFRAKEEELGSELGYVNERMLFHGTTAADTIVRTGFDKGRSKPSGMFGTGIYFAEHSSKSNQYVFGLLGGNGCPAHSNKNCYTCNRKMLLCRVALGKMYKLKNANKMSDPPVGHHSVLGEPGVGLQYPEYAVYSEDQIYPEYLITYKIVA